MRMSIVEIQRLPLSEKLQIMEAIWEELCAHSESVPMPEWHRELLDARQQALEAGQEEILDWDAIKNTLGSRQ